MPKFISTRGRPSLAIGICDRCKTKVPYSELRPDGNSPGLRVCKSKGCWDRYDPWRLPARQPENITLRNPRLDRRIGSYILFLADELGNLLTAENGDYLIISEQEDI